ncbi:hypothetical protein [Dolichospermum circinale]|uniref:hypothetical protein n=1 Tax=Dolichospermum circinale TaxID=109265 RepID=UPI00232D2925|nr:hypothetical protein [Dolichospermum circinale]MDB9468383.1 hypothetical protein [Dolichospermum circinale CS-539/09]MDB9471896.1 hypothetical protein [Dolichospermum circinale CS-539]
MMEITCPLSKSTKLNLIEEVTTKDLNKQYQKLKISRGNLLIDQRFFPKILNKLANLIGRILALGLKDYRVLPCGHSVTSVYQKL